jgi:hypothetical protein
MKLIIALLLLATTSLGQRYISINPSFYTGVGTVSQRTSLAVEAGKQWGPFSTGVDLGKTNLSTQNGTDTTWYLEVRPSLDVFQQDKFTNTLNIGIGYIFSAEENIMTELTTGIQYTPKGRLWYNLFFGTYYFSGKYSSSSQNYLGLQISYLFKK